MWVWVFKNVCGFVLIDWLLPISFELTLFSCFKMIEFVCWVILIWFCVLLFWVFWVISYSSWYVSLTYVCPLSDVLFCFIRTIQQNVVCSWVSTNEYTHLSSWFIIVNVALSLSLYDTNRVLILEYTYTVLCCCGLFWLSTDGSFIPK